VRKRKRTTNYTKKGEWNEEEKNLGFEILDLKGQKEGMALGPKGRLRTTMPCHPEKREIA
jgi:hypothetical protein